MSTIEEKGDGIMNSRFLLAFLVLFSTGIGHAQYSAWTYSANITIGTTPDWADIPAGQSVSNFPVLIRLEQSYFDFNQAGTNGEDIRFADGVTPLNYQIEYWDRTAGKAALWVRIGTITGNSSRQITMYWGNAGAQDESDGAAVFQASNGFAGVWHLSEEAGSASGHYKDATANGFHGTSADFTAASDLTGLIGRGKDLDGGDDIEIPAMNLNSNTVTMSAWVNLNGIQSDWTSPLFSRGGSTTAGISISGGELRYHWDDAGYSYSSGLSIPQGEWVLLALVISPGSARLFLGGSELSSAVNTTAQAAEEFDGNTLIGQDSFGGRFFRGKVDEVRIEDVSRSDTWMKLAYENQRGDQNLVSLPIPENCTESFDIAATASMPEGEAVIQGTADCALKVAWALLENGQETPLNAGGAALDLSRVRVVGDSTFSIRFKALFSAGWQTRDVAVTITEAVPEPQFTIVSPLAEGESWNGADTITIKADITNLEQIQAGAFPEINYRWSATGLAISKGSSSADSLLLRRSYADGTLKVVLCLENGGIEVCDSTQIVADRNAALLMRPDIMDNRAVTLSGGHLIWNRTARIKIWSPAGRLLFQYTGKKGEKLKLTSYQTRLLTDPRHIISSYSK
jgi:hypothetical protein